MVEAEFDECLREGELALRAGDLDGAVEHFRIAGSLDGTAARQASASHLLGVALWKRGDRVDSARAFCTAVSLRRRAGRPKELAESLNGLGAVLVELEEPAKAVDALLEALKLRRQHEGAAAPATTTTLNNLAVVLERAGQLTQARELLMGAVAPLIEALGPGDRRVGGLLNNLGGIEERLGHLAQARTYYVEAVRILRMTLGDLSRETQKARGNLARVQSLLEHQPS